MDIYYNPLDTACKSVTGGIRQNETCRIKVFGDVPGACALVLAKDGGEARDFPMQRTGDGWEIELSIKDPGLYWYYFRFDYFRGGKGKLRKLSLDEHVECYQITVYREDFTTPEWIKGGIMYQIFPDRFRRKGDVVVEEGKILHESWKESPEYRPDENGRVWNRDFFGGNFQGVIEKLDYLRSLHVSVIYFNPIFRAFSNHRYDTGDYMEVDPMLGTEEDFRELIAECGKRGIRVILDGVFNHTGDDSRYFNRYGKYEGIGAYQSQKSKYYAWYNFQQFPEIYDCWWGIKILPALNENNPDYIRFITGKDGVLKKWMSLGVAGYRLDVADELPDEFIEKIRSSVREEKPDGIVIGEVWEDASNKIAYSRRRRYFQGTELDSVMNYPLKDSIINFVMTDSAYELSETICMLKDNYPKQVLDCLMNFLDTHDTPRILTILGGLSANTKDEMAALKLTEEQRELAKDRLKSAALLLFTLFGVPCIYYGDEIGMEGYSDPFCRMPFAWDDTDEEILSWYRRLSKIRAKLSVFKDSEVRMLYAGASCVVYERRAGKEVAVIYVNRGDTEYELEFSGTLYDLTGGGVFTDYCKIGKRSCAILSNRKVSFD